MTDTPNDTPPTVSLADLLGVGTNPTPANLPRNLYAGVQQEAGPTLTMNSLGTMTYSFGWDG